MGKTIERRDEDGDIIEIVYCRATKCRNHIGRGKCSVVHTLNSDDKISVNSSGVCENYFPK
jgi:hypothetical protein